MSALSGPAFSACGHNDAKFEITFSHLVFGNLLDHAKQKSISSLSLMRQLGVQYNTAWVLHQKIMHTRQQDDDKCRLQGIIHVAGGYLGGKRSGVRGRGAKGKPGQLK